MKVASKSENFGEDDEDKTSFEKFLDSVKISIFNVLYVLLDDEEPSNISTVVAITIEFIEMCHFSFAEDALYPWKNPEAIYYIQKVFDFYDPIEWIRKLPITYFIGYFYFSIFFVILVILDIVYVSYSFSKKKFAWLWPLKALKNIAGLFVTALFLPILETFIAMHHCYWIDDKLVLMIYQDYECYGWDHIIHCIVAVIVSIIFIMISMVAALSLFETKCTSKDISARANSRALVFQIFIKFGVLYMYSLFSYEEYQWMLIGVLLFLSINTHFNYRYRSPFYNEKVTLFYKTASGLFLWANVCLAINQIFKDTYFNSGLEMFALGVPFVLGYNILERDYRVNLLFLTLNQFHNGEEIANQLKYLVYLITSHTTNRQNTIILEGYIYHHEDTCNHSECQLKIYKKKKLQQCLNKLMSNKNSKDVSNAECQQLLLTHVNNMYKQGLQKFPSSSALRIQYALFLIDRMSRQNQGLAQMKEAAKYNPPFDEQFIIYRYQLMSEQIGSATADDDTEENDIISIFAYESNLRNFQIHVERSARLHMEFWNILSPDRPDIMKLNQCGHRINKTNNQIEKYWSQLQKHNNHNVKVMKIYAQFLIQIQNNKTKGEKLLEEIKNLNNGQNVRNIQQVSDNLTSSLATIHVSATNDDSRGLITQCNAVVSKLFGYTHSEIINHHVEKIMPQLYAHQHSQLLNAALAKNELTPKERPVFAKHKSGYIFPVWIQLKMLETLAGQQFVAYFKTDKKNSNSITGYVLLDMQQQIQGFTSSFMRMMGIDAHRMNQKSLMGKQVTDFSKELNVVDTAREGKTILMQWTNPHFTKNTRSDRSPTLRKKAYQFLTSVEVIEMGKFKNVGWALKLQEQVKPKTIVKQMKYHKEPLFQFTFDIRSGKFIRSTRQQGKEYTNKNPYFEQKGIINWMTTRFQTMEFQTTKEIEVKENTPQVEQEVKKKSILDLKKGWSKNIQTYQLQDGKFKYINQDQLNNEAISAKEQEDKQKDKLKDQDEATNHIQGGSRLHLNVANTHTPPAIKNLRLIMNLVLVAIMAISISQFTIISTQFSDIGENFKIIFDSYQRIAEMQRIAFDVRQLVLINEKKLTSYQNYTHGTDFKVTLQDDLKDALEILYDLQGVLSLSQLSTNAKNQDLLSNKSVNIYYKNDHDLYQILKFSLSDAVLQYMSVAFTVQHLNVTDYQNDQQDVHFILYNSFNDLLIALQRSSKYYVDDIMERKITKNTIIIIVIAVTIGILIISLLVLLPAVTNVSRANIQVLSLFSYIPSVKVVEMANKCEVYLFKIFGNEADEQNENQFDEEELALAENETQKHDFKKREIKVPKNAQISNFRTIALFGVSTILVSLYFIGMFVLSNVYINHSKVLTDEINSLSQVEYYYLLTQNAMKEMIYNPEQPILNVNSFEVVRDSIEQFYTLNHKFIRDHIKNRYIESEDYVNLFSSLLEQDLCQQSGFNTSLLPQDCSTFAYGTATQGLQSLLIKYTETMRETLKIYLTMKEKGQNVTTLLNSQNFQELYNIQFRFIKDGFRLILGKLKESNNTEFQFIMLIRLVTFIIFIVAIFLAFILLWLPYVGKLQRDLWRTRNMLSIIPVDILMKIPKLQEFVHDLQLFNRNSSNTV